ncbi:hypothetical protein C7999DRAFT_43770 [Corynascus novoguineensis]|uniref:Uncharacterized protein n=1 Tax=Corynascus novoguineensis TaxID=1126955 RepID=A0AAN7HLU2_9PEZI|nr:hypothetical protein C7999DRAFT_43770 [Corynascus novoguineensis]
MEGQRSYCQIRLSPYFRPARGPLGLQTRRLTRHHFLSSRWGLGRHHVSTKTAVLPEMSQSRPGLPARYQEAHEAEIREVWSTLDYNFGVLQSEIKSVDQSILQLAKVFSGQIARGLEKLLETRAGVRLTERLRKVESEQRHVLQRVHELEMDKVRADREMIRQRLKETEKDSKIANMQAAIGDLVQLQHTLDAHPKTTNNIEKQGNVEEAIITGFLQLRTSIRNLAESPIIQLRPLAGTTEVGDSLLYPQTWNRVGARQRQYRVMATIFHLLFRRILRPGLRMFGVQIFLRSKEHQTISASEAQLRSLERELEVNNFDETELNTWVSTTIETMTPLRDITHNIEGIAHEILEALSPVVRLASNQNANKVRARISTICEEAVRLKLVIRQAGGNYKVEVPSRDAKKWGEPGCDEETRGLGTTSWLQIVDHETELDAQEKRECKQTRGDIAYIPFGALTKLDKGSDGKKTKIVLEKGWVIAKGGVMTKPKRKVTMLAGEDSEQEEERERQPRKRFAFSG